MDLEIHGAGQQTEVVWHSNWGERWEEESPAGNIHGEIHLMPNARISGYDKTETSRLSSYHRLLQSTIESLVMKGTPE